MKLLKITLGIALFPLAASAANSCHYSVDASSVKIGWTAFKTSEKTPVKGSIKDLEIHVPAHPQKSLKALLLSVKASGAIDGEKKSDSGNPQRDTTLFQKFFS